jgi:hypothetical protein
MLCDLLWRCTALRSTGAHWPYPEVLGRATIPETPAGTLSIHRPTATSGGRMNSRSVFSATVGVILVALLCFAQSTATVQGTVSDATGAVVPGAKIVIRNEQTGEERATQTDASGAYLAASLPLGTYRVSVSAPGMQSTTVTGLTLQVGRAVVQNFSLKVATATEMVEIRAAVPVVETASVAVGTVINQRTVQEIPLNGRHFVDLGLLIPGSVTPPQNGFLTAPLRGQGSFSFNTAGNREDTVNFMINGINLNDPAQNQITFQPSINTVSEFKVDNSTYSAEYGRNSGAIVNIATRAGTNQFHGEAFEYLRNNAMDARNYFNRKPVPQSPFKRNQYGASLGGPIWKDHTFFFISWEALRQRQGLTINQTVFTDAQRAQGAAIGNPTVQKLLPLIPRANSGSSLFVGSATAPVNIDQGTANISHSFGSNDRINGYIAIQKDLRQEPTLQGNNIPGFGDTRESRRQIFTLNETHVFSPSLVNEVRLGYNRIHIVFAPNAALNPADFGMNIGVSTAIGLPQINLSDIGLNFGGPAGFPQGRGDYVAVLSDTLSWVKGRHSLKYGGEVRRQNNNNFGQTPGTLTFNTVNDFFNGLAARFTANPVPVANRMYATSIGGFVVDQFRATSKLTLDLGIRYEWNGTPVEAMNRFTAFDPATSSLVRIGTSGYDEVYHQSLRNFQPRVGFAWDLLGNHKTVLRGAYAVQTDQPVFNLVSPLNSNPPFANPVSFAGPGTVTFADAIAAARAAGSLAPTTVARDYQNPYVQSWNFNIQQELPGDLGLMIGYFGNKGTHLRIQRNLNQFLPGTTTRPYSAVAASSAVSPGLGLGNIAINQSTGNSLYTALWITATKRFSHNIQFNSSYTWSKSLDYNSLNSQGITVQDSYNLRGDRGLSDFDARHRFVFSGIYDLPFRGNRFVEGWELTGILQLQSGNPINIITNNSAYTGVASLRPDILGDVPTGLRPAPDGNVLWFPAFSGCTGAPTAGCLFLAGTPAHFGNLGRNAIIGPGFQNLDFSVIKTTAITERVKVQFRADSFDLFNHPNFGQPNRVVSSAATFGEITTTRFPTGDSGSSRQIQLALKLIF